MANPIFVLDVSEEGIVATHFARVELPALVSPTPDESRPDFHNTVRPSLVVIGCMNLADSGFEFDSSFVVPRSKGRFTAFGEMMTRLRRHDPTGAKRFPPVNIFGHADPTGEPEYNKHLSGRRARAVFGVFTRDVALWEQLFSNPFGGDNWGTKSIQHMLSFVGSGIPFYEGPIDGAVTPETKKQTKEAIEEYQRARSLVPVDGKAGPNTRKVLFAEYMDEICRLKNDQPYALDPVEGFLFRGKDKTRKGDVMGCGEFNPVLLLSKEEEDSFKKAATDPLVKEARDRAYAEDRRVVVFVYKHDVKLDVAKWPCPRATEGGAACKERFWADHKERLARTDERRRFKLTGDTFACRWYHGFAAHSPCESGRKLWVIRLRKDGARKEQEPLARAAYVVQAGDAAYAPVLRGFTDENGQLEIPVFHEKMTMTLKVDWFGLVTPPDEGEDAPGPAAAGDGGSGGNGSAAPGGSSAPAAGETAGTPPVGADVDRFEGEENFLVLRLDGGALKQMSDENLPSEQRLYNLGFGRGKPGTWDDALRKRAVSGFQKSRDLPVTGALDADTRLRLKEEHEGIAPPPPPENPAPGAS